MLSQKIIDAFESNKKISVGALKIYEACQDLDFPDYEENASADLMFIQTLVDELGQKNARKYVLALCE